MKRIGKFLSLALSLIMAMSVSVTALAEGTQSITVNRASAGATYQAYKIFDVTKDETNSSYAYTIDGSSVWYSTVSKFATEANGMKLTQIDATNTYNVTFSDTFDDSKAADLAEALYKAYGDMEEEDKPEPNGTAIGEAKEEDEAVTAEIKNLEDGYYLITSSLGSKCILDTTGNTTEINEKNELPSITKKVNRSDDADGEPNWQDSNDTAFGRTVYFKIEVTAKAGAENYKLVDMLADGLKLDGDSIAVAVNKSSPTGTTDDGTTTPSPLTKITDENPEGVYSVTAISDSGFTITFEQEYLDSLGSGDKLIITYNAVVQDTAAVGSTGNKNEVTFTYGEDHRLSASTTTNIWEFSAEKVNSNNAVLSGAKFSLYSDENCTTPVELKEDTTSGKYKFGGNGSATEIVTDKEKGGKFTITGLDSGTYYLVEKEAPSGYNKLTDKITVTISDSGIVTYRYPLVTGTASEDKTQAGTGTVDGTVTVINNKGTVLPSTGGIGTTIFYILGAVLVVGSGVLLVVRKRMKDEE